MGHGFPPPAGMKHWSDEAVTEIAHDFLVDHRTPKRLAHLAVHGLDDDGFDRLLHRMVLNFLRDEGRRTETGRLMLRLRDVLGARDEFVIEPGDRWRLASQPSTPSTVPAPVLLEAAWAEPDITVPRWSHQTRRQSPVADAPSLARLCQRVLAAAGGTVALDALAQAIGPRLGLAALPIAQVVDDRDPFDTIAAPQRADGVVDSMRAAEIFVTLGRRERLLLANPGTPVRELRAVIGVGPSQGAAIQAGLRTLLAAELEDDDSYESVFFHLVDQAKGWAADDRIGRADTMQRQVNTT
jgi:hypothetical protein